MNKAILLVLSVLLIQSVKSQSEDQQQLKAIYDEALTNGMAYDWLNHLSNQIGGRLSGSVEAQLAVDYTKNQLDSLGLDRVWLQPVMVPKWVRGAPEFAYIQASPGVTTGVRITALGGSISTPATGIKAQVIEVKGIEDLEKLGRNKIEGKIVFYNRPMDPTQIDTFKAYNACVDQQYSGAAKAGKYGAVGVIVRSMNLRIDDFPHTGSMSYEDTPWQDRIPAAAISTKGAELLSTSLKLDPQINFYFKQNCRQYPDVKSYNVIGEIKGSIYPNEVMVVAGNLASWDLGEGAHNGGAGSVQAMDVLRLLNEIEYRPKRTIRVVLYMNEENDLRGGKKYAELAQNKIGKHVFALESNAGGYTPRGFSFDCSNENFAQIQSWQSLFEPYLMHQFDNEERSTAISPLKSSGAVLASLRSDSQRYFDHHNTENDTFEHVNKRELELGAAAMASLVYLMDKYGPVKP